MIKPRVEARDVMLTMRDPARIKPMTRTGNRALA
jgi:hypothetical protein